MHGHECRLRGAGVVGADREGGARPDELAVRLLVQAPADEGRASRHEFEIRLAVVELIEASDGADTEPVLGRRPGRGRRDRWRRRPTRRRRGWRPAGRRWRWRPAGRRGRLGRGPFRDDEQSALGLQNAAAARLADVAVAAGAADRDPEGLRSARLGLTALAAGDHEQVDDLALVRQCEDELPGGHPLAGELAGAGSDLDRDARRGSRLSAPRVKRRRERQRRRSDADQSHKGQTAVHRNNVGAKGRNLEGDFGAIQADVDLLQLEEDRVFR